LKKQENLKNVQAVDLKKILKILKNSGQNSQKRQNFEECTGILKKLFFFFKTKGIFEKKTNALF